MKHHSWIRRSYPAKTAGKLLFRAEEKVGGRSNEDHSSFQLGCRFKAWFGEAEIAAGEAALQGLMAWT